MKGYGMVQRVIQVCLRRYGRVKSFEDEVRAGGGLTSCADAGVRAVEVRKVVGSVGRAETLRGDFCYRRGPAMTARFHRVGRALRAGTPLPPLELYKVQRGCEGGGAPAVSEYYVVDGHHRVAVARRLGQDFLDAHVVEYRLAGARETAEARAARPANGETGAD